MPIQGVEWPSGARCAVALTFDNFGESFDLLRYGHAAGADADGIYSPRRGVPRILDLLERHSVPATFFLEGWNVRKYGKLAREIVDRGHEVGGHGWMHEAWNVLEPARERELVEMTTDAIEKAVGHVPQGWRTPGGLMAAETLATLRSAGYGYDSSMGDDDIPYWIDIGSNPTEQILELPWSWTLDDAPYYKPSGVIRRPDEVVDIWIDEFEAAFEMTGFFMLVCHPRYSGRPARTRALEKVIEHVKGREGVWFARCQDVARVVRQSNQTPWYVAPARMGDGTS